METMCVHFDTEGDILYIQFCKPYRGQISTEINDGVVVRLHPETHKVESFEILDASARTGKLELPLIVTQN
jgi:uncharacterized protein YuzE